MRGDAELDLESGGIHIGGDTTSAKARRLDHAQCVGRKAGAQEWGEWEAVGTER